MKKICEIVMLISSLIFLFIGFIFELCNFVLISNVLLIVHNIVYSIGRLEKRITFLMFNISFFTLLVGKNFLEMLDGIKWYELFSIEIQMNTQFLLYISLFSIFVGNVICEKINKSQQNFKINIVDIRKKEVIRKITTYIYIFVMVFATLVALEKGLFVQKNNYIDLYTSYVGKLPSIIYKIANTSFFVFCLLLSTFPEKKSTYRIIGTYIIYLIITLLSGGRSTFVVSLFTIIIYIFIRNKQDKEIWLTKKIKTFGVIAAFFLIVFLGWYNTSRSGIETNLKLNEHFIQFFEDQGGSVNIISYAQLYKNKLPKTNSNYTFSAFTNFYRYSSLGKLINSNKYIDTTDKYNMALYGNNLGASISYIVLGSRYLNGHGLGTQYIAELFVDFGIIGIIIFNLFIGYILTRLTYINYNSCYKFAFLLSALSGILYIPRNFATTWIVNTFFSIQNWIIVIIVYMITNKIVKNKYNGVNDYANSLDN